MPSKTSVRTADGAVLTVHDWGGEGHPLLLAHACGLHGLVWQPAVEELAKSFRCVAYDHRGHGDSASPPNGDFNWRGLAADVLAIVDGLGLTGIYGLGHSSGASALLLAEQRRPGTFRALYCYEPVLPPFDPPLGPDPGNWLAARVRSRRSAFASREEALRHYATKRPFDTVPLATLQAYVDYGFRDHGGGVVLKCAPETEARVYEMATAHDGYSRLGAVGCPVILAWGERTDAAHPSLIRQQAARLPRAVVEAHAELGHLGPLQDPRRIAEAAARALTGPGSEQADSRP